MDQLKLKFEAWHRWNERTGLFRAKASGGVYLFAYFPEEAPSERRTVAALPRNVIYVGEAKI